MISAWQTYHHMYHTNLNNIVQVWDSVWECGSLGGGLYIGNQKFKVKANYFLFVCTLTDNGYDVIKCSKLQVEQQVIASYFTVQFWTFYDVISIINKSTDNGKPYTIYFLQQNSIVANYYSCGLFCGRNTLRKNENSGMSNCVSIENAAGITVECQRVQRTGWLDRTGGCSCRLHSLKMGSESIENFGKVLCSAVLTSAPCVLYSYWSRLRNQHQTTQDSGILL